jgi:hypothetical protein
MSLRPFMRIGCCMTVDAASKPLPVDLIEVLLADYKKPEDLREYLLLLSFPLAL